MAETAELLSDVQVSQVRVVAQSVENPQSLFGEEFAVIPKVLFHAGMKRTMKRIAQQLVGSQQQQQDNQPQTARQSVRQEREKERRERGQSEEGERGREEKESVRKGER